MLDEKAMQIARSRLSAEAPRRQHLFQAELQRVQSELVMKGQGRSGALIQAVADVCAMEIEESSDRLWEIVRELLGETKLELSAEAVSNSHRQIDELWTSYCSAEPKRALRQSVSVMALVQARDSFFRSKYWRSAPNSVRSRPIRPLAEQTRVPRCRRSS
jgi:hypothetical protein